MRTGITKHTRALKVLPARCAAALLPPAAREAGTATTARTALASLHADILPGDRRAGCSGIMDAVAVWVRKGGEWAIIHRCRRCGTLSSNRVAADDTPMKLMSIAMKPLCEPSFPLERIEEMTQLMDGGGQRR